jgi:iron complex outermembrane receptor protein
MRSLRYTLSLSTSALAVGLAALSASPAAAQAPGPEPAAEAAGAVEEIVVTGTSIRGVAPVGANLVSVGREAIESIGAVNVQQILKTVPSITGLGGAGVGQTAGNSYYAPTIHSLGSSASNSTLTLIDGHRLPLGGTNHALADPSMLPPLAIERVEVLAEGASSTYGSDAVAGVVNFITRRRYDGLQLTGQAGFGEAHYRTYTAGLLWGRNWETGSAMVALGYSRAGPLVNDYEARPFLQPNHLDEGGTNFQSFNCSPATIQMGTAGNAPVFLSPTSATTVANVGANAPCDTSVFGDRIGRETRYNMMVKLEQQFGDKVTVGADFVYSDRSTISRIGRGGIQARVFQTDAANVAGDPNNAIAQANPFYVNPPGQTGAVQTIRWNADELLGPGAINENSAETWYASSTAEYRISDRFRITALGMIGQDNTLALTTGSLCTACALLALNGTTNANGLANTSNPGRTDVVQQSLTAANALDVWNPVGSNRTPASVIERLKDSRSAQRGKNVIKQARLGFDGALFELPAGAVRIAAGGELLSYTLDTAVDRPNGTGPSTLANQSSFFPTSRSVKSLYGEVLIPLVGPEMGIPLVRRLDLNVSGRYDKYNDFGSTTNPKIAGNWEIFDGLKLRANWAKSFVAPSLRSLGDPNANGLYNESAVVQLTETQQVPVSSFPLVAQIPGIPCSGGFCQISGTTPGIRIQTGNPGLDAQRGTTWSVGFDFAPNAFLSGFRSSVTLFNNKLRGGITSPPLSAIINSESINSLLVFYPQGLAPTDPIIAAAIGNVPITTGLPSRIFYTYDFRQRNTLNLTIQGLDIAASYRFETPYGVFTPGGSLTRFLKYDQNFSGGRTFSVLGTTGFNTTFPSIKAQGRAYVSWQNGPISADLFFNYVSSYRNWSGSTVDPVRIAGGAPTGEGGDRVKAYKTFDAHIAYTLPAGGLLGETEIYLDGTNIFENDPPFYNSAAGYDPYGASPIGRVISVGFRTRY